MKCLLRRALDETEFLSPYGIRALSRHHPAHPYELDLGGDHYAVGYEPGESRSAMSGGNADWCGPVWLPINFLLVEGLHEFRRSYGDDFTVACPTGADERLTLMAVADRLGHRLSRLFLRDADGKRTSMAAMGGLVDDPHTRDHVLFHEYFHGDTGAGPGPSHQTGWTALVALLLQPRVRHRTGDFAGAPPRKDAS